MCIMYLFSNLLNEILNWLKKIKLLITTKFLLININDNNLMHLYVRLIVLLNIVY